MGLFKDKHRADSDTLYAEEPYDRLPEVPVQRYARDTVFATKLHKETFQGVLKDARKNYGKAVLRLADKLAFKWMKKGNLLGYEKELHDVAKVIDGPGQYILNLSNEFACTSAVVHEYDGPPALYRCFDWPIKGFGNKNIILQRDGKKGHFWDITYPGMVGTIHGMAPRRFAIAINRAPIPVSIKLPFAQGLTKPIDRWVQRIKTFKSDGAPAPLLLRKVFEECANYDEAVEMLSSVKLSAPTIFTVCGTEKGQGCVIERDRDAAYIRTGARAVTANHWQDVRLGKAHARPYQSQDRLECMAQKMSSAKAHFDWVAHPMLNDLTRMVCEMSPKKEIIRMVGTEGAKKVTRVAYHRLP